MFKSRKDNEPLPKTKFFIVSVWLVIIAFFMLHALFVAIFTLILFKIFG